MTLPPSIKQAAEAFHKEMQVEIREGVGTFSPALIGVIDAAFIKGVEWLYNYLQTCDDETFEVAMNPSDSSCATTRED